MKSPVVIVIGTRPGAIKSIPVYFELKRRNIPVLLLATFQHDQLLQQVLDIFSVTPDLNLNVMKENQDLFYLTSAILGKMQSTFGEIKPSLVLVHGDTTTAFAAALAAFYLKIPIGHMEAGLRTGNMYAPFPEEMNRKFISTIAQHHFAPTALNIGNLLAEGINRSFIYQTGNVVVDALYWIKNKITQQKITVDSKICKQVELCKQKKQRMILLTAHRRESFDNGGLARIFKTVKKFAQEHEDLFIFYPYHPNPNVIKIIEQSGIADMKNIYFSKPIGYIELIYLLFAVDWIMTDSGGIQEEGISIGKKVLILRDVTERIEGVWEGVAQLVGTNEELIYKGMKSFYENSSTEQHACNIYGDGRASEKIVSIIEQELQKKRIKKIPTITMRDVTAGH